MFIHSFYLKWQTVYYLFTIPFFTYELTLDIIEALSRFILEKIVAFKKFKKNF